MFAINHENKEKFNKNFFKLLFSIVFFLSNFFLFGPVNIYQGNIDEFAIPLSSILISFFFPALIIISILFLIGLCLPNHLFNRYIVVILALGILIWLQGNIFVWKYGLLDGQGIDWSEKTWRGWIDITFWILILIMAVLFYRKLLKVAMLTGIALFLLQMAVLFFISVQKPEIWKQKEDFLLSQTPPKEIFQFSEKINVIHLILDGFQSDIFYEIVLEDLDYYRKVFDGFTFFEETIGSYPTTYMSIPALLSSKNYKNEVPMSEFVKNTVKGKTIPNVLHDNGYDVDFVMYGDKYFKYRPSGLFYNLAMPYGAKKSQYKRYKAGLMFDLVLFRFAPHFLKKLVYNNQSWLIQCIVRQEEKLQFVPFNHKAFFDDLIDNMSADKRKPVYKYIHLNTTHAPMVMNKDCEYVGEVLPTNRDNLKTQAKCALTQFIAFLEKLKRLGIYDNSLMILQADHGAGMDVKMKISHEENNDVRDDKIIGSALPLMMIKPPNRNGSLKISKKQTMLIDIPSTICSILKLNEKFDGQSMFDIKPYETRERKFFYYRWVHENWQNTYFDHLEEFIIKGSVFNYNSWQKGLTYHSPKTLYQIKKLDFGTNEANCFLQFGWGGNEHYQNREFSFNWALGNTASLFLTLPPKKAMLLTANIKSFPFDHSQIITIILDGHNIGSWKLSAPWTLARHNILLEPDIKRPDISLLEFNFSEQKKPDKMDLRPLAVMFESISLSEPKPYNYGAIIKFGVNGNSQSYQMEGWSFPEKGFTWSIGQNASLNIPINIPKTPFTILKANISAFLFPEKLDKQIVQILINKKKAGEWILTDQGFHEKTLTLPKSLFTKSNRIEITFNTPDAASPALVGYNNDTRVLGIAFQSVVLNEKP